MQASAAWDSTTPLPCYILQAATTLSCDYGVVERYGKIAPGTYSMELLGVEKEIPAGQ